VLEAYVPGARLRVDAAGKPHVEGGAVELGVAHAGGVAVEVSVAHTGAVAVVAVAPRGVPVGVDVEERGRRVDAERVARRALDEDERAALREVAPAARGDAFLRLWTRKEAVLKGVGTGLRGGPAAVRVLGRPGQDVVVAPPGDDREWLVRDVEDPAHVVAVAVPLEAAPLTVTSRTLAS
jgi:phosphopantetheinyl transferase